MNEKEVEKFIGDGMLDEIFRDREERLYTLTQKDKNRIQKLVKEETEYQDILDIINELFKDCYEKKKLLIKSIESYIDRVNIIGAYDNEKFYKIGFSDAISLVVESITYNS